jgi:hypothetical protein
MSTSEVSDVSGELICWATRLTEKKLSAVSRANAVLFTARVGGRAEVGDTTRTIQVNLHENLTCSLLYLRIVGCIEAAQGEDSKGVLLARLRASHLQRIAGLVLADRILGSL